jgi:excisionase family DNA binding protein
METITPLEAADYLKVSTQTIRNWLKNGTLPYIRLGGRYRIEKSVVEQLLIPHNNDKSDPLR